MKRLAIAAAATTWAAIAAARPLPAQPDCFPPPTANESRTLALSSLPLVFSSAEAPGAAAGRVRLGIELSYLPRPSDAIATPTLCRPGKGPENTTPISVFPRPRLALRLPGALVAEASWVPPIEVSGVKSNLFGFALGREMALGRSTVMRLRGHATLGSVEAPITCPDELLDDETSECFGGQRSRDRLRPNLAGVEAAFGWTLATGRLHPYAGAGYNWLRPRFRVNFTNRIGETDRSRVEVNLERVALFGGVSWRARNALLVSGEIYGATEDGMTTRVFLSTALSRDVLPFR
jgi:hypothetical protein